MPKDCERDERAAPADWPAPFVLQPGSGLFAQYGYGPDHTRNVPAFDSADRPHIRSRTANGSDSSGDDGTVLALDAAAR